MSDTTERMSHSNIDLQTIYCLLFNLIDVCRRKIVTEIFAEDGGHLVREDRNDDVIIPSLFDAENTDRRGDSGRRKHEKGGH